MPESKIAKRGGAVRVRTIKVGANRYAHVFVVRKRGPRGGRTELGRIRRKGRS
ncbi:MAG: hypothetical protein ACREK4_13460 [Candidatus Rokuibacteriota bacterium]